ncbi:3-deoxy-D-manno-octulosonic acid transferase [Lentibacter sp. XHP0401]|uniref:3-deoxy-D-manno-octulosonic acid transferase n=1 Tax=Lentibacter sp. XHP0401 TaxID=2984334 RepID=UPI0021E7D760|nr:glycosyltransferase N-terminal domain-containing protein [Lentibacter sp. XHP0401]MCV2892263.1 hypothetical protein [Lentibacter sp. XHP0401]
MKKEPQMPLIIRLWLALSRVFAFVIHVLAKRLHSKQGISKERFVERLGVATVARTKGRWIWVHAASLGEAGQITQLVAHLQEEHGFKVIVTTVTESGANWVAKSLPNVVHQYLPLDTPRAVSRFLENWSPELAVFIEADIWPRLVLETASRRIPLALVNARPSKSRERAPKSYRYLLQNFSAITCKSTQVLNGFLKIGLAREKLFYFGDLRASVPALSVDKSALAELQSAISNRPVWIAASSHADDEAEILEACRYVLSQKRDTLLIWAPRHPQRAKNILDATSDLMVHQRSKLQKITQETQIYLADTFGELGVLFSCSKIVFMGGSFGSEGGHNPYEPACFGCYILTGPHVQNHQDAIAEFTRVGAAEIVTSGAELGTRLAQIIAQGNDKNDGKKGRALVLEANSSASKTGNLLVALTQG